MTETLPEPPELDPAVLAGTSFGRSRKGLDPAEVTTALGRAADALRTWQLRDRQLLARIEELEERVRESHDLDEHRIASVLGEETARIVTAARDAAGEIRSKAEEQASRLLRETEESATSAADALKVEAARLLEEAEQVRSDASEEAIRVLADSGAAADAMDAAARDRRDEMLAEAAEVLDLRTREAEGIASGLIESAAAERSAAEVEAAGIRIAADADASETRDRAREDGRSMVAEAKALRERMLVDLAERRRTARRQIEGARGGRDRIIELLRAAAVDVGGTIDALEDIDEEIQLAADVAATSVDDDIDAVVAELEAELGQAPAGDRDEGNDAVAAASVVTGSVERTEVVRSETSIEVIETVETIEVVDAAGDVVETSVIESTDVELTRIEVAEPSEDSDATGVDEILVDEPILEGRADEAPIDESADVIGIFTGALSAVDTSDATRSDIDDELGLDDIDDIDDIDDELDDELDDLAEDIGDETAESTGATVHDLFARIRAEGLDDPEATDDLDATETPGAADSADDAKRDAQDESAAAVADEALTALSDTRKAAAEVDLTDGTESEASGSTKVATRTEPDSVTELLDQRDKLLVPIEKQLSRALRRLASDEQNEVLDHLRRVKRGRPDIAAVLPDPAVAEEHFIDALLGDFAAAVHAGSQFWESVAGSSSDSLFSDDTRVRERLGETVREFLSVHRAHLERTFADADEAGLDTAELGDRIRASYRDWRSTSLAELAGDLATTGFTQGERAAAGPGTPWLWVVDNGGLPCADGEDNALAGPVACEEPFPTGDITPPAHSGCRCILIPAHR